MMRVRVKQLLWGAAAAELMLIIGGSTTPLRAAFPMIALEPVVTDQIVGPTGITHAGDGSGRLFVTDQRGTVHIIDNGVLAPSPLLDISSQLVPEREGFDERGLLGLAFHPEFGEAGAGGQGKFYVYYSAPSPDSPGTEQAPVNHQSVISEFRVQAGNPNLADMASERVLMTFNQPQFNHNGGYLEFGPDGHLYITTGDGGSSNDNNAGHTGGDPSQPSGVLGNAQDLTTVLGKVLRIDVDGNNGPGGQYGIPGDNPLVGQGNGVREEVYAYGLRNPWRAAFDDGPGGSQRLFVADVGQGVVEEVNVITAGGNYGWRIKEGTRDFDATVSPNPPATLVDPIAEYAHPNTETELLEVGISVTGGAVYRGDDFPELQGKYIFGDWSTGFQSPDGTLLGLEETSPGEWELSVLDVVGGNPIGEYIQAFGMGEDGEVYLATRTTLAPSALDPDTGLPTGSIYRITVIPEPTAGVLVALGAAILAARCRRAGGTRQP
jgi:glucose/arabinose dehydrogenase